MHGFLNNAGLQWKVGVNTLLIGTSLQNLINVRKATENVALQASHYSRE